MARRKPKKAQLPPVSLGGIVKEELPLEFVHYPGHYGTFFAFSESENGAPYLCQCSQTAIANYHELRKIIAVDSESRAKHTDGYLFPKAFQRAPLQFKKALCHRCNLTPPSRRYCIEMYGTRFVQAFGWYINQAYLRFGIVSFFDLTFLEDITPAELTEDIPAICQARIKRTEVTEWFKRREPVIKNGHISLPDDYEEVSEEELAWRQDALRTAERTLRQAKRSLEKKIENIVREEFGFRKIGSRWVSETLLYNIILKLYPDQEVQRHHRPDWLEGLELDIFLPKLRLGLEYQGQQHFHPIEAWGGEQALHELKERDTRKEKLCRQLGIFLVAIDFTEPLTIEHIRSRIEEKLSDLP